MSKYPLKSPLVDVTVMRHAETEKAILVSDDGDKDHAVWVPKLHIEIEPVGPNTVELTMPEWLALDKGLI